MYYHTLISILFFLIYMYAEYIHRKGLLVRRLFSLHASSNLGSLFYILPRDVSNPIISNNFCSQGERRNKGNRKRLKFETIRLKREAVWRGYRLTLKYYSTWSSTRRAYRERPAKFNITDWYFRLSVKQWRNGTL